MAITYRYVDWPGGGFDTTLVNRIRLGTIEGFTELAGTGEAGTSNIVIDDPDGTLDIVGHKLLFVEDDAAPSGNRVVYAGLIRFREYKEGDSLNQGAARKIGVTLDDLNALLQLRDITGTDGKRPRETAKARLTWLLASDYMSGIQDFGLVVYPSHYLDAFDFRGMKVTEVLAGAAIRINANYWVKWNEAEAAPELYFDNSDRSTTWASDLQLADALADVDSDLESGATGTGTFALAQGSAMTRDPTRVYSGVSVPYSRGTDYLTNGTIAARFIARDGTAPNATVKTKLDADRIARRFLIDASTEDDLIEGEVELPAENVNDIRAGHLIPVKVRYLGPEGYASGFVYCRVMKRVVKQIARNDTFWRLGLTLSPSNPFTCGTAVDLNEDHGTISGDVEGSGRPPTVAYVAISCWFGYPCDDPLSVIPVHDLSNVNDGDPATYSYVDQWVLRGKGVVSVYWTSSLDDTYSICSTKGTVPVGSINWQSSQPDIIEYWDGAAWVHAPGAFSFTPLLPTPAYWIYTFAEEIETSALRIGYSQESTTDGLWNWMTLGRRVYDWQILGA